MEIYAGTNILRIKNGASEKTEDLVAVEKKVRIHINGEYVLSISCTPSMIREFVAGVIHNEALVKGSWCAERMNILYGPEINVDVPADGKINDGERVLTSGCAGGVSFMRSLEGGKISDPSSFSSAAIQRLFMSFQKMSGVYKMTGGVHSAALSDGSEILAFAEDIGRHNAVDKVIGYALLEQIPFEGKILLASGRLSSEIVLKCARSAIPMLVSRAAPTTLAVEAAVAADLTVIGFVRGERMNIYSAPQRISDAAV